MNTNSPHAKRRSRLPIKLRSFVALLLLTGGGLLTLGLLFAAPYSRPGLTQRVSLAPDGTERSGDNGDAAPVVSADGRFLAFSAGAALVPEDNNLCLDGFQNPIGCQDVYVKDLRTGALTRVSVSTSGAQGTSFSNFPAISATGRFVVFQSLSSNLILGDSNGRYDIFVRDRDTDADGIFDEADAVKTVRVSVSSLGAQSNNGSERPSISADGRHVVFGSDPRGFEPSTLVPSDTNAGGDVYVHDRDADGNGIFDEAGAGQRTTALVSVSSDGTQAVAPRPPGLQFIFARGVSSISANGRYVVFDSDAHNLVPEDKEFNDSRDNDWDVFARDRDADGNGVFDEVGPGKNATIQISVNSEGKQGTGGNQVTALNGSISGDGRYVAFESAYNNMVPSDNNAGYDIFVRDRDSDGNGIFDEPGKVAVNRVNVSSDGTQVSLDCKNPFITANGRYVTFHSLASNLVPGDTNGKYDQFVHDRETAITERLSVASDGTQGNNHGYAFFPGYYSIAGISEDGSHAGFASTATNLVTPDTNNSVDIFLRDRGPAIGIRGLSASVSGNQVAVSGRATFAGLLMSQASDPTNDGATGASDLGGELTGASLFYRGEAEELFIRFKLLRLPNTDIFDIGIDGSRSTAYVLTFTVGGIRYEARATAPSERAPVFELFRCETTCVPQGLLTGSYGTTGPEVLIVLPRATLGAGEGAALTGLRAFTAPGDSAGEGAAYDTLLLSDAAIPAKSAGVGVVATGVPESQVNFNTSTSFSNGFFNATVDTSALAPGTYDVWAKACLGGACGAASVPVTLGGGGGTPTPTPTPTATPPPTPTPTPTATPTPTPVPTPTPTPDPCATVASTPAPALRPAVLTPEGFAPNRSSYQPALSVDGRHLAFTSDAGGLAPSDRNLSSDVFVKDYRNGKVVHVSRSSSGIGGDFASEYPAISADGRFVTFQSRSTNLVPDDVNETEDIFVHDRDSDSDGIYDEPGAISTELVSVATDGTRTLKSERLSQRPSISPDGRYIAFTSGSPRLVSGDLNGKFDVFLRDRIAGTTELISISSDETAGDDSSSVFGVASSISAGGRYVAFYSLAANLVPNDFNGNNPLVPSAGLRVANSGTDVFVRDRQEGTTTRVSLATDGTEIQHFGAATGAFGSSMSADGRFVAFESTIFGIVPEDGNTNRDIFVRDRDTDGNGIFDEPTGVATRRVSIASDGTEAAGNSFLPFLSANGRYVVYESLAANLVAGDSNAQRDVFVHDLVTARTERVSLSLDDAEANNASFFPAISGDGRRVAFWSQATNLVPEFTSGTFDVIYLRDRGPEVGVRDITASVTGGTSVMVAGQANFRATTLASAVESATDGLPGSGAAGAELVGASLVYRGDSQDLFARFALTDLPTLYAPCCVNISVTGPGASYTFEFNVGPIRYELRATTPAGPAPVFELYKCEIVCTKQADLTGSYGTTGTEVLISLPRSTLGVAEGTALTALRAFTSAGDSPAGAVPYDQVLLAGAIIPVKAVSVAIAPPDAPANQVLFGTPMIVTGSAFTAVLDSSALAPGAYNVWAKAAFGTDAGAAFTPISLSTPPLAAFTATPTSGAAPLLVAFDASGSADPDPCDRIVSYSFDFGDGTPPVTQVAPSISHTYAASGIYHPTLSITDSRGKLSVNTASLTVQVSAAEAAVSRKTHGTSGVYDINLPLTGGGIECRTEPSGNHHVVFSFPASVTVSDATVSPGGSGKTAEKAGPPVRSADGREITVNLANVSDAQKVTVTLLGVNDGTATNDVSVRMGVLAGDVDSSGIVTTSDTNLTKAQALKPVTQENFRMDVNGTGSITTSDTNIVKANALTRLP